MKTSIASSVFVNYSIEDTVKIVSSIGFDGLDIWGGRPHIYRNDLDKKRLIKLSKLLNDEGITVPSFMPAFFRYPHSLSNPNPIIRNDSIDYMRECIYNAVQLNAQSVLLVPGRSLNGQSYDDAFSRLVESIFVINECAQSYDIRLAIEPVNHYVSDLVNTSADALKIITKVNSNNLSITLDTGHINLSSESIEDAINRSAELLQQIHINDNDGKTQQNLVLGEGTFNFVMFSNILKSIDYPGFLSLELGWEYTLEPESAAIFALQRMKSVFIDLI